MKKTFTILIAFLCGTAFLHGQIPHKLEKSDEYWLIDSKEDLIWLADELNLDPENDGTPNFDNIEAKCAANYRLEADITFDPDSSKVDWNNDGIIDILGNDSSGLAPIGYWSGTDYFSGIFDGQYHVISNIFKSHWSRNGFFGNLKEATIENLVLLNYGAYYDSDYVAGIACRDTEDGSTGSTISRCWVEGNLRATRIGERSVYSAGIIGRMEHGQVIECVSKINLVTNTVTEESRRGGGLIGYIEGKDAGTERIVKDCYSVSTIDIHEGGGLIGRINDNPELTTVTNCYSAGLGLNGPRIGAFIGDNDGAAGTYTSCYWDSDIMAVGFGAGEDPTVFGLATVQFSNAGTFDGWDFATTWKIGDVYGVQRPYLQWQDLVGEEVSVNDLRKSGLIKAYPNPVTGTLNIENAPLNASYRMMNLVGQTIESGLITSSHMLLNTENYEKGIYLLKIGDNVNKILVK